MTVADLFAPDWVPLWVSGLAMVALALWLFLLDVGSRPQRIFALLLGLRGLTFFVGPIRFNAGTLAEQVMWTHMAAYLVLPLVPLTIYFVSVYPRRRGIAASGLGRALALLTTVGILTWYLLDHSAYATVGDRPQVYSDYGPLFILAGLRQPVFALAGLILALEYRRHPTGSRGFSLFLVAAGFTLNGIFDGMLALLDAIDAVKAPDTVWGAFGWSDHLLPVVGLPVGLMTCAALYPVVRRSRQDAELQEVSRFMFAAVPMALLSPLVAIPGSQRAQDVATFVLGIWRLVIPFLVVYALMRYRLFELDIRMKAGVRRGIILGAFTITFFLVTEAAEAMASGDRGPVFGIAAAGILSLASRPIQTFASHAAEKFMPDTKPIAEQSHAERRQFYLEQFNLIFHDGEITPKERRMLDQLRITLSLAAAEADEIERTRTVPDTGADEAMETAAAPMKDTKLELAIKGTLVAAVLALVFGMLSEGIESQIPVSNQLAGLIAAAFVAVFIGPIEWAADHLTHRLDPKAATEAKDARRRRKAFEKAVTEALADGHLSERDLTYLAGLQGKLGISSSLRWRLEKKAAFRSHNRRHRVTTG